MPINLAPAMTAILVKAGAFSKEPLILLDIGARGGLKRHWHVFKEDIRLIAFEPDPEEFARLNRNPSPRVTVLPFGLGAKNETRTLHVQRNAAGSSLYSADPVFMKRTLLLENATVVRELPIALRRLDEVVPPGTDIDFIDLDAEGAELEIMQGGIGIMSRAATLGLYIEVRFLEGFNTPLFWQTDQFLRENGFSHYDLSFIRESRRALPYPMVLDQRAEDPSIRIFGPTIGGQLSVGDATYLRDAVARTLPLSLTKILKLASLFEIFGQSDSAAELILVHRSSIDAICDHRALLDALVPVVAGKRLTYDDYMQRFFAFDPKLRSVRSPLEVIQAAASGVIHQLFGANLKERVLSKAARLLSLSRTP